MLFHRLYRTGATDVLPFSHLVRRHLASAVKEQAEGLKDSDTVAAPGPTIFAHCDNSKDGAMTVLENNVPEADKAKRKNSRWAIMNIWRPLVRPVTREPLALLDAATVDEDDLIGVMSIFPQKKGAAFGQAYPGGVGYVFEPPGILSCSATFYSQSLVLRPPRFSPTRNTGGTTLQSLPLTRLCSSSNSIPRPMVGRGRHRTLRSSLKMIVVRHGRACTPL